MAPRLRYEVLFNGAAALPADAWARVYSGTKVECVNYLTKELDVKRQSGHNSQYCLAHRKLFKILAWNEENNLFGEGLYGVL